MICLISISKLSDVLPTSTWVRAIDNIWRICLGVNILIPLPCVDFIGNIIHIKPLRANYWPS